MEDATASDWIGLILYVGIMLVISVGFYIIPTVVAAVRKHQNVAAIAALNLLLGWTLLGWVVAMVWSLTATSCDDE